MKTFYHGVDLHSTNFKTHFIEEENDSNIKRGSSTIYNCEIEKKFIPMLTKNDYICLEASTGAFQFAKIVKPYVKDVIVINPFDFKSLYMSGKKTDKIDAKKLSERLYTHIQSRKLGFEDTFPGIYVPEDHIIELRGLFSTYETLKKQTTGLKNRVHSIIKQNLITYDSKNLHKSVNKILTEKKLKPVYEFQIQLLLNQINNLNNDIIKIENEIKKITYTYHKEEILILISIMGISFFTACAIMSDIADIKRFKNSKKLCSYLRAGMRVDSSNEKTHIGKINKKSRKLAFKMILQGLQHIVRYNHNYYEFKERKLKGKSNGKVRCALVRKTIVAIFYMLKNKERWKYSTENKYKEKLSLINCELKKLNFEKIRA